MLNLITAGATYLFPGVRALKLVKDGINVTNSTNPLILTRNITLIVVDCCTPSPVRLTAHCVAAGLHSWYTKIIKEIIVSQNLSDEHKIYLLKTKLNFIIHGECGGKIRFLVMAILATVFTFTISGVSVLSLILEALYRLFQKGKILKAIYSQIVKTLAKRCGGRTGNAVPVEHLLE